MNKLLFITIIALSSLTRNVDALFSGIFGAAIEVACGELVSEF